MGKEIKIIRALPLTPGGLFRAFLDSRVLGPQLRIGKIIDESRVEIPHIIGSSTVEESVQFAGKNPPTPGKRVVVYNA